MRTTLKISFLFNLSTILFLATIFLFGCAATQSETQSATSQFN